MNASLSATGATGARTETKTPGFTAIRASSPNFLSVPSTSSFSASPNPRVGQVVNGLIHPGLSPFHVQQQPQQAPMSSLPTVPREPLSTSHAGTPLPGFSSESKRKPLQSTVSVLNDSRALQQSYN